MKLDGDLSLEEIVRRADIPRELYPMFEKLRKEALDNAEKVYQDRVVSYDSDHPPYEEQVYGPLSLASEIYKRARRLAALFSPLKKKSLRGSDINRILDICVDTINYLSWTYALVVLASGFKGHANADDAPSYLDPHDEVTGKKGEPTP